MEDKNLPKTSDSADTGSSDNFISSYSDYYKDRNKERYGIKKLSDFQKKYPDKLKQPGKEKYNYPSVDINELLEKPMYKKIVPRFSSKTGLRETPKDLPKYKEDMPITPKRDFYQRLLKQPEIQIEEEKTKTKTRKVSKFEIFLITMIYIGVILAIIYFIMASYFPNYLPFRQTSFAIKADDSLVFDKLSSFYIDDNSVLGEKTIINNITYRPIVATKKFNLVFKPKENIKETKANLEINLLFDSDKSSDIYINDKLVFPDLNDYEIVEQTGTDYMYIRKDLLAYVNQSEFTYSKDDSTEHFIYDNFPGASVWSTRNFQLNDIEIPGYVKQITFINATFRDNLKLAVYAEDNLTIDFTKQDLNGYIGADEYTVDITDINGRTIYSNVFQDDGDKTKFRSLGNEQKFNIDIEDLKSGVYYIIFTKDKNNDYSDSTIKNIKVNSNKILIIGNFLPWSEFSFYTKTNFPNKIGFYYWWTNKNQTINVTGDNSKTINLTQEWFEKRYTSNFTSGEYQISTDIGYVWIYNTFSSPYNVNWFDILSINNQQSFNHQDIIVIDKKVYNDLDKTYNYKDNIETKNNSGKIGVRVLEKNAVYFKDADLEFS